MLDNQLRPAADKDSSAEMARDREIIAKLLGRLLAKKWLALRFGISDNGILTNSGPFSEREESSDAGQSITIHTAGVNPTQDFNRNV